MDVKPQSSTLVRYPKLANLRQVEASGILYVGVISVDIQRNTKSEGSLLDLF